MAALAVVIKIIGNALTLTETIRVSFIYIPWLLAGAIFGPIGGCLVSGISDLIVMLILPNGPFIPLQFVSNLIYPLFIGLIFTFVKGGNAYVKIVLGAVPSLLICTLGLGSLGLYLQYGYVDNYGFFEYLLLYRTMQVPVIAVNVVILCLLVRPLQNVGIFPLSGEKFRLTRTVAFAVSEISLTAIYVAALIILFVNGMAPDSYVLATLFAVLFAGLIALILGEKFTPAVRIIILLLIFALITGLGAISNALSSKPNLIVQIVLSSVSGMLAAIAIALGIANASKNRKL